VACGQDDALAFELEPIARRHQYPERFFPYKSESALTIRNRHLADPPDLPRHELIRASPNEWHCGKIQHPIADNQVTVRSVHRVNKRRDVRWVVLPISVEKQEIFGSERDRASDAGLQSGALSEIGLMPDHLGACSFGFGSSVVVGTVVDHQYGINTLRYPAHDAFDKPAFTIGRNNRQDRFSRSFVFHLGTTSAALQKHILVKNATGGRLRGAKRRPRLASKSSLRKSGRMDSDNLSVTQFAYRLAAVDLDGTLLGPDKEVSAQNAAAVQRLNENGARVIIASGRRHQNSIRFQRQLGLTGPIIACQGGLIRDGEQGNVVEAHFLPLNTAREIVDQGEQMDVDVIYYHLDHLYVGKARDRWVDLYESRVGERTEAVADLDQLEGRRALKIVWYGDPDLLKRSRPEITARFQDKVDVLSTELENLEFMPRGVNKATALEKVARELGGVQREQILAFGDGENDVPMLSWAGLGVAMKHGNAAAKAAAKMVSPPGPPETAFARAVDAIFREVFEHS
jgi:Cof subfamily protein (haloacid dehalogenase superfamily)